MMLRRTVVLLAFVTLGFAVTIGFVVGLGLSGHFRSAGEASAAGPAQPGAATAPGHTAAPMAGQMPDLTAVAQRAVGSVTNISSTQIVRTPNSPFANDPFFRFFLN